MKKGWTMGYFLGRALAIVVVIPLVYYLITIIFYAPNNITEAIINQYIKNIEEIRDSSAKNVSYWDDENSNGKLGLQSIKVTYSLLRHDAGTHYFSVYIFYSKKYNKYFKLMIIAEGGAYEIDYRREEVGNGNIIMTVNKDDLNNPAYGTIDNPVPVFKFISATNESIRDNNKDFDQAYMDTVFRKNVEIYLKYIMPKDEFKARFGVK